MKVNELTEEEKRVWCFMVESERINGKVIVPPKMKDKAEEVLKKLGVKS